MPAMGGGISEDVRQDDDKDKKTNRPLMVACSSVGQGLGLEFRV